jgi:hypothetical protein
VGQMRTSNRRAVLAGLGGLGATSLAGCVTQGGASGLIARPARLRRSAPGPAADERRPHHQDHRLPAAVPRRGTAPRRRNGRRQARGPQLRPRRQRLVAVVGLQHDRRRQGAGGRDQGGGGDRLRRPGPDLGPAAAAGRRQGDDLRQGAHAPDPVVPRHRHLVAGLARRRRRQGRARLPGPVGGDGPHLVRHLPDPAGPARRAGVVERSLHPVRRRRRRCARTPSRRSGPLRRVRRAPARHRARLPATCRPARTRSR